MRDVLGVGLVALLVVASLVSCKPAERRSERATVGQALALQVSEELDVEAFPQMTGVGSPYPLPSYDCGTQRCLAVYGQTEFGSTRLRATRLSFAGEASDLPRLDLGFGLADASVAARGDEFLV